MCVFGFGFCRDHGVFGIAFWGHRLTQHPHHALTFLRNGLVDFFFLHQHTGVLTQAGLGPEFPYDILGRSKKRPLGLRIFKMRKFHKNKTEKCLGKNHFDRLVAYFDRKNDDFEYFAKTRIFHTF